MKRKFLQKALALITLFCSSTVMFAQNAPNLGTAANFVLFTTTGAVGNTGISHLTGNVGSNAGDITGFGNVNGVMQNNNGATIKAADDLLLAYNEISAIPSTFNHAPLLGNGDTLFAGVYAISGATTLSGNLFLDAKGDPDALFIFKISAAFSTLAESKIKLINGAQACKIFWTTEDKVEFAAGTSFKGNLIADNAAITLNTRDTLEGRALSTTGAVNITGVMAYTPIGCGSPTLRGPAAPDLKSTACYAIFSGNGDVANAGVTNATGDIGTNVTKTVGFDPLLVNGMIHENPDGSTAAAAADLLEVYTYLNTLPHDIELLFPAQFGQNLVLTPHTYLMKSATALTDTLYLNGLGNPDAVFVIKITGAFSTSTSAKVLLVNGTQAKNVYWKVDGAISIGNHSEMKGTFIANNAAIDLTTGVIIDGRAHTTNGALSTAAVTVNIPSGSCINVMPLTWISFQGKIEKETSILNWNTANELNASHFEIEKSTDGKRYNKVGSIDATGTAGTNKNYSYNDKNVAGNNPFAFYRIKMVDNDAKFSYSGIVALQLDTKTTSLSFYPNPVRESATLMVSVDQKEAVIYRITDQSGRIVRTQSLQLNQGSNNVNLNIKSLRTGVYELTIQGNKTKERIKFVKQ